MIHRRRSELATAHQAVVVLKAATVVGAFVLVGTACSNTAFESQPVEQESSTSTMEVEVSTESGVDNAGGDELALAAESPYEEPDILATDAEEEISEAPAAAPEDEPVAADPDDTADVPQVALGVGESAVCGTVQIGRDALGDGADELLIAQQALLVSRVDLVEDRELSTLLGTIEEAEPVDGAVFDAALSRCEELGFQP